MQGSIDKINTAKRDESASTPRSTLAILILLAALWCAACKKNVGPRGPISSEIVSILSAQNPNPVNVSPLGDRLLLKSLYRDDFELVVTDRATGRAIASNRMKDTQLAPTWRADQQEIAFLADEDGNQQYRLFVMNASLGTTRQLTAPVSTVTALRWAPTGTQLAYLQGTRGEQGRKLIVVDSGAASSPQVVMDQITPRAGFIWSPDGERLASVRLGSENSVTIVTRRSLVTSQVEVAPLGETRALAWSDDGMFLLATLRKGESEFFGLVLISLKDSTVRALASPEGDVSGPLFLPHDRGFAYHVNRDGEITVFECDRHCSQPRRLGPSGGTSAITGFSSDGRSAFILHTGSTSPPALYQVELATDRELLVHSARRNDFPGIEGERIDVRSRDGLVIPVYLWRAPPTLGRAVGAIVRIHGGPDAQALRVYEAGIQLMVRRGYHVLSVNYRGSTGYGKTFERSPGGDGARVDDVLAARDYATKVLGVEPQKVIILGHSYGARLAADAAARDPKGVGGLMILSFVPRGTAIYRGTPRRLAIFEGANDVAVSSLNEAKSLLSNQLGSESVDRAWTVLAGEGHTFHRLQSWGRVYETLLSLLDGRAD